VSGRTPGAAARAVFFWTERWRNRSYGRNHPLAIPRVPLTYDLIRAYGGFGDQEVAEPHEASPDELAIFHDRAYLAAYARAERDGAVGREARERHRLGTLENPYFERFYTLPAIAAGASLQGAEAVLAGRIAFNPAGGMHHARASHAQGFCFLNDPALAILRLRRAGWRVLYVDIDAHHGDGVAEAFRADAEVLTLSLHMDTAYAYPHAGGGFEDQGEAGAGHTTINLPLPAGMHDAEYRFVFERVWEPALARFRPDALVLQAGADALALDPLAKFALSTQGLLGIVAEVLAAAPRPAGGAPRLLVTGGGGYHPLAVARFWTGLWALLAGRELPTEIPAAGAAVMRSAGWDGDEDEPQVEQLLRSRLDSPRRLPLREEVRRIAARVASHRFFADWRR
jgi:acetoin utilization protein AcuC